MHANDVMISIDKDGFMWNESDEVRKLFFSLLKQREMLFNDMSLKKMARFYTGDVETIYEANVVISKNKNPIKKGETMDAIVSMFFVGESSCHRISFYFNDYKCKNISTANKKLIRDRAKITKYVLDSQLCKAG